MGRKMCYYAVIRTKLVIMKVFISMGMRDKTEDEIRAEMNKVFTQISMKFPDDNVELIDSVLEIDKDDLDGDSLGLWYLGESLKIMADAHVVVFVDGYEEFRGCRVERSVAEDYGKLCIDFDSSK